MSMLREVHPSNAELSMAETFFKFILEIPVQFRNDFKPMVKTLLKSTETRFVHPSNACVPIEVTVLGIVKVEKREAQFLNNELEIDKRETKLKLETDVSFEQF